MRRAIHKTKGENSEALTIVAAIRELSGNGVSREAKDSLDELADRLERHVTVA